jgi:predicted RNA binding protein YcfA (HicA-like mRNA interferase family)
VVKASEIEKLVTVKGWYEVGQRGSHRIYKHDEMTGLLVIPFHGSKDLPKGERSILKKAGLL